MLASARKVAELFCKGQQDWGTIGKLDLIQGVGTRLNRTSEVKSIVCNYPNFQGSVLELITQVVGQKDPNALWNLNNLLFSLNNTTNLGTHHVCSVVANDYLTSLSGLTKTGLLQQYPNLVDSDLIFTVLAQSNPNFNPTFDSSHILDYLNTLNTQRMDSKSEILVQKNIAEAMLYHLSKKAEAAFGDEAQNVRIAADMLGLALTPSKQTIMDLYLEKEAISWDNIVDHNPILNLPILGILQEPLMKFYVNDDTDALYNALDIVSANGTYFSVNPTVNGESLNINAEYKWSKGESLKASFMDVSHSNTQKSNMIALDVLVHTIVYKSTVLSPPLDQEIGLLLSKAKTNPLVWNKIMESVQFQFHNKTNGNYIDHIQVIKNIKNNE